MKFLYLSDTHITAKTPSSRLDDIQETIKLKFKELGVVIAKEGITAVIHGGDMFHRPEVSNKFVGEIAEIIRSYGVPFYVVPGNHDLQGQNEESLPHTKLGLLISTGVIKMLNRKNPVVFKDGNLTVSFEGQEYHPHIDKNPNEDYKVYNQTADYKVLVPHSMMLEKPFHEGTVYTLTKDIITSADIVLGAHYHPGFKPHEINGTTFLSPGSMLRVEASTHSINSKPKVYILEFTKACMIPKEYELKTAKEGKEVFSQVNLQKKVYNTSLENFNNKLRSIKLDDVNIVSLIDEYVKTHPEDSSIVQKAKDEIVKVQREQVVDNGFVSAPDTISINKVEIKNFQTHTNRTIDFVNGLNTIVGESNAGKTAILRAIYWGLYDKPSGSAFITTGKKSASVKIHLSNGYIIERKRTRSTSGSYFLTKPDGTTQEYKGFANNVPIDIINAHQMPEVNIAGKKYRLNISSQLEGAFMVTSSSNEKMAMIGALVDADRADTAKKVVLTEKRNLSANHKKVLELKESEAIKLEGYAHLDKMKSSVEMLEIADSKLDSDEQLLANLEDLKRVYEQSNSNLVYVDSMLSSIKLVDREDIDEYNRLLEFTQNLKDLSTLYKGNTFNMSKIETDLSILSKPIDRSMIDEYNVLIDEISGLNDLKASHEQFTQILDNLAIKEQDYTNIPNRSDIEEYSKLVEEVDTMLGLKFDYDTNINIDFTFGYDLDELNNLREEYVTLVKEVSELDKCNKEMDSINFKFNVADEDEEKINEQLEKLNNDKKLCLERLSNEVTICEHCGSEVTADKLLEV